MSVMNGKIKISPFAMMIILLIIMRMIRGDMGDPVNWITTRLVMLPAILTGLSLHEFGHAIVSDKLGDPTPRSQGRVTINPMAHVDPVGLLCLIFVGFGWGVPVQINPGYYKHRRRDEALTAVAGVTINFCIAVVATIITKLYVNFASDTFFYSTVGSVILEVLQYMIFINVILMLFNLLPVPPLDGFNILTQVFNLSKYSWYQALYNNGGIILILLVVLGGTSYILGPLANRIYGLLLGFIA